MRTIEPTIITTREAVEWTKNYTDYPASQWQLNYYFRGPGTGFNVVWGTEITADGDDFVISVPGSRTDNVDVAGKYKWQAWVTEIADTDNKICVGSGYVDIRFGFDPETQAAVETRSLAKQIVDSVDAAMLAFSTSDVQEYEISTPAGTRKVKRSDRVAMKDLRKEYASIVAREVAIERGRNTGVFGRPIFINVREN